MMLGSRHLTIALIVLLTGWAGCAPGAGGAIGEKVPPVHMPSETPRSDIRRIIATFAPVPWLVFDSESGGKIDGFKCSVFLISPVTDPKTGKVRDSGVFGSGTIIVEMYLIEYGSQGRRTTTLLQTWELPPEEAYPWRSREAKYPFGWGYGLRLPWDKKYDLVGEEIGIMIKYRRDDGIVVGTRMKELHVPLRGR